MTIVCSVDRVNFTVTNWGQNLIRETLKGFGIVDLLRQETNDSPVQIETPPEQILCYNFLLRRLPRKIRISNDTEKVDLTEDLDSTSRHRKNVENVLSLPIKMRQQTKKLFVNENVFGLICPVKEDLH